ncbi:MAG: PLDc N-terminal domain-containing protein, partial [Clostridia bacterium]|nr:PLDc N-terminal domain-containing protein [Clostridia bacterium]
MGAHYLVLFYVLLQVALSVHVLMTKHMEPQSAMLWLLLILVVPGFGIVFYLCFGFNLSKSRTRAMAQSMEELNRERYEYFKNKYSSFSAKLEEYL